MDSYINLGEYLGEEEKKTIAHEAYKEMCIDEFRQQKSRERIFCNAAYSVVSAMVDDSIDGDVSEFIKEKAMVVIGELSNYTVFHAPDAWDKKATKGFEILQEETEKLRGVIHERLTEIINDFDRCKLTELLQEEALNLLDDKLFGGSK
tara:strand:- start:6 stop:452 length:447 start_codon:yes stop_codon:yes gene_type:complete